MGAGSELIGRAEELGRLAEFAAAAEAGRGTLVLLAGEAGAGKTALARAAARFRTLEAASLEAPGPPYRPIASVLRAHGRVGGRLLSGQPGVRDYLACVLPELGTPPPVADQDAVFEAVAAAFREMAEAQPLAVLLDDLHWSDEATPRPPALPGRYRGALTAARGRRLPKRRDEPHPSHSPPALGPPPGGPAARGRR